MPQIYQFSKHVSYLSFKNFLENERADSYNTQKVFQELWKKSEHFLLKIFSLEEKDIFDIFKQKIENLIKTNHFDRLNNLLNDFYNYIDYRNEIFLINNTLLYFLDFHFLIWKKFHKLENKASDSLNSINYIVEKIEKVSLKNKRNSEFYSFIKFFKMHLDYIKQHYRNDYEHYIKHLLKIFTFTLFRTTNKNISLYKWRDYFPDEWRISKQAIMQNKLIPSSIFDNFTKYVNNNLYKINGEREKIIKNIIKVIFKNFDPNLLMRLLFFVLTNPVSKTDINNENIENLIINLNSFELTKFNIDETETLQTARNQISDYKNIHEINTINFITFMFPEVFTANTLDSIIKYLDELKTKYSNEPSAYYNIETYNTILNRIIDQK